VFKMVVSEPLLICSNGDGKLRVFAMEYDQLYPLACLSGNTKLPFNFSVTRDNKYLSSYVNEEKCIRVWDLEVFDKYLNIPCPSLYTSSMNEKDNKSLLYVGNIGDIGIYNIEQNIVVSNFVAHSDFVSSIKHVSENQFYTSSGDQSIKFWDLRNLNSCVSEFNGHQSMIFGMELLNNGIVASYSADMKLILWNQYGIMGGLNLEYPIVRLGKTQDKIVVQGNDFFDIYDYNGNIMTTVADHEGPITSLYTTDNFIFTGSTDRKMKAWDNNGNLLNTYGHKSQVNSIVVSQNNSIITGTLDGSINHWSFNFN